VNGRYYVRHDDANKLTDSAMRGVGDRAVLKRPGGTGGGKFQKGGANMAEERKLFNEAWALPVGMFSAPSSMSTRAIEPAAGRVS